MGKSREFYLLKMTAKNPNPKKYENVPSFMQPVYGKRTKAQLDAYKHTNNSKQTPTGQISNKRAELLEKKASALQQQANATLESSSRDTLEPIHDNDNTKTQEQSMSKRAAGFSHVGAEKVSMSTVLSGMGAVTSKAAAV